jgi:hypothetical protein
MTACKCPSGYNQLSIADGKLIVRLRNDLDRDEAVRLLRQIADRVELLMEAERTYQRKGKQ